MFFLKNPFPDQIHVHALKHDYGVEKYITGIAIWNKILYYIYSMYKALIVKWLKIKWYTNNITKTCPYANIKFLEHGIAQTLF